MRTLLNQPVSVHYWQFYVTSSDVLFPGLPECFAGQQNGLCGAAVPGYMFLNTGLHSGEVGLTVELHEEPPPLAEGWPDVPSAGDDVPGHLVRPAGRSAPRRA